MSPVDLYCERVAPDLLGEPLNAVTNAAFLIAAWFAWRYARQSGRATGGAIIYGPALVLVTGLGLVHFVRERDERSSLIAAAGVFMAALGFRTIDNAICDAFPAGTHFLWHLPTALSLYLAMRALIAGLCPKSPRGVTRRPHRHREHTQDFEGTSARGALRTSRRVVPRSVVDPTRTSGDRRCP